MLSYGHHAACSCNYILWAHIQHTHKHNWYAYIVSYQDVSDYFKYGPLTTWFDLNLNNLTATYLTIGLRKYGMNVWITESSMLHMETKSCIGNSVLISKKDFESARPTSALSEAERLTEEFININSETAQEMNENEKQGGENNVS